MNKLDKMHILDIIGETNIYLTPSSLYEIWKKPEQSKTPGLDRLKKEPNLARKLIEDEEELLYFLGMHDNEIDKTKFLIILLRNYKIRLSMTDSLKRGPQEIAIIEKAMNGIRKLLKGIDETYVFFNSDKTTQEITHLTIINTKEEAEGKSKEANTKRLQELEKELQLADVAQGIFAYDLEFTIATKQQVGADMRKMVEFNTVLKEHDYDISKIDRSRSMTDLACEIDRVKFIYETIKTLWLHIEEVNIDKMLLCSAFRYIEGIEDKDIKRDAEGEVKRRLEIIRRHIKKNVSITVFPDIPYSLRDFDRDLKRFVGKGENVKFLLNEDIKQLREGLLNGEITLNSLGMQIFEALSLENTVLLELLRNNPDNYILFLRQEKCPYNKDEILKDIINTQNCSEELLQLLCRRTDITPEEIRDLFDREIIIVRDLSLVGEKVGPIITDETLFAKYKELKSKGKDENQDEKTQLERYALAYRNTELVGKTPEEIQEKGEEFIANIGDELETSDLVPLYGLGIIPLKVAVDWGGEEIVEELLESESLKPIDARTLRDEGLLNEKVLERLFKKCTQMSYSYQVSLVFAIFDGQTPEEQQIRERLAQYYHMENSLAKNSNKIHEGKRKFSREWQEEDTPKQKIKMRDPGAKYNLLAAVDKDVKIEQGIIDGHIIFHYPNIDGGTVLIEKLHRIKNNRNNGQIEIKADNESATYVLSEEEFIKIRAQLIKDGKVDRTELTQRWWITRDSKHWIPHTGISAWENAIIERFHISEENSRYTADDLSKIEQLVAKSIESKKEER